ncbi:hypothetical protein NKH77_19450 [Streptomyces sp. M19]
MDYDTARAWSAAGRAGMMGRTTAEQGRRADRPSDAGGSWLTTERKRFRDADGAGRREVRRCPRPRGGARRSPGPEPAAAAGGALAEREAEAREALTGLADGLCERATRSSL